MELYRGLAGLDQALVGERAMGSRLKREVAQQEVVRMFQLILQHWTWRVTAEAAEAVS